MTSPTGPAAVLLDAGGVFVLPDPARVLGAFARAECDVDPSVLAAAHYRAAARIATDIDVETGWAEAWLGSTNSPGNETSTVARPCRRPRWPRRSAPEHLMAPSGCCDAAFAGSHACLDRRAGP